MDHGIYVHIPFCLAKCSYCDFYSVAGRAGDMPRYVAAVCREIADTADSQISVDTLYIGGGTPSLLAPAQIHQILLRTRQSFQVAGNTEVSCEANPETLDSGKLDGFLQAGVNRLSIGIQSLDDPVLRRLDRVHTAEDAVRAVQSARVAGFRNLSIDLISALPGMTLVQWEETLRDAAELGPDHISVYTLEYHPGTRIDRLRSAGRVEPVPEELEREIYLGTIETLDGLGYRQYEISNFARPGMECRHNGKYWAHLPYLGFGASAHSFRHRRRSWNLPDLDQYIDAVEKHQSPMAGAEVLTDDQIRLERLMLGLRTADGAEWPHPHIPPGIPEQAIHRRGSRIVLTREGLVLYESICETLARYLR